MSGTMQPDQMVSIQLQLQQWEHVLRMLAKQPFEVVAGTIGEIQRQCQMQAMPRPPMLGKSNGAVVEEQPSA